MSTGMMPSLIVAMILLPLAGSILNGLVLRPRSPRRAGVIATLFAGASFACAVALWMRYLSGGEGILWSVPWFSAGGFKVDWGFTFDAFTAVMALVVTGIGTLIHLYSVGYMSEERTPARYFAYLNLFLFAMLTLISGNNLVVLFVGWEGVGLCSYLLIGYWFQDPDKVKAGMKAFIVNRIGDAGFLIGIFICYQLFGSVGFAGMSQAMPTVKPDAMLLNLAALFLFIGAMGKSAQIPLYVWLPDAMAGPTPVSALIHAATMVTAGVYLLCRMSFLYSHPDVVGHVGYFVALIGGATALLAALIALGQRDIKKVLAYSTVSQLGLMFLALGCGAYIAAVFHLLTHAFFKALLFLGSGSVIHGLHGEQDIFKMGGLKKEMPVTFWTFAVGTAAICGLPPLSGFFSKDLILFSVLSSGQHGTVLWALGSLTSFLTAFYMTRLFVLTFLGSYRGHAHAHESPAVMTVPLIVLAIGSALAGFLEVPHDLHLIPPVLSHFLSGALPPLSHGHGPLGEFAAMGIATLSAVLAISLALWIYTRPGVAEHGAAGALKPLARVLENKFFVDELYGILFVRPFELFSSFLAKFFDGRVIDATIIFPSRVARAGATVLSFVQWGSAQFYMLVMLLGGLFVLWCSLKGLVL